MTDHLPKTGVVVIGRNEGERLRRCLQSLSNPAASAAIDSFPIVYVDSASTDGSVENAQALGAEVVALDMSRKFTAARARNAGFQHLLKMHPDVVFVQFVDGDCELDRGWLPVARQRLVDHPQVAAVCGRRRERFPDRSIYNRICDLEWDTPIGLAHSCGGDALMRVEALEKVGGYRESLIAGEEPELCFRLRQLGYQIERLEAEMTLHDANMTRFSEWFQRAKRAGHAYAERAALYGHTEEKPGTKHTLSNVVWGVAVPATLGALTVTTGPFLAGATGVAAYSYLFFKSYEHEKNRRDQESARLFAANCVAAKFPEALGAMKYWKNRALGRESDLIEYKGPGVSASKEPSRG